MVQQSSGATSWTAQTWSHAMTGGGQWASRGCHPGRESCLASTSLTRPSSLCTASRRRWVSWLPTTADQQLVLPGSRRSIGWHPGRAPNASKRFKLQQQPPAGGACGRSHLQHSNATALLYNCRVPDRVSLPKVSHVGGSAQLSHRVCTPHGRAGTGPGWQGQQGYEL